MERQVVDLRARHRDALLLFECGYRMRLFAEDAEFETLVIAGAALGIGVAQYKHFRQASVPVHRALLHCRALVVAGHKVGIVRQVETVAMRSAREAADGRQRPVLQREVVEMYTRATIPLVEAASGVVGAGDEVDSESDECERVLASRFILCVVEATVHRTTLFSQKLHELSDSGDSGADSSERKRVDDVHIGVFAHDVHTGESLFDEFQDDARRHELRDALSRIEAVEIVLPVGKLSVYTEQLLQSYTHARGCGRPPQPRIRCERVENAAFAWDSASAAFAQFFDAAEREYRHYATRPRLPALCVCCFGGMQRYLAQFALQQSLASVRYASLAQQSASAASHGRAFSLSSDCVRDLDIFRNSADRGATGSLFSVLNHTKTEAGARTLRAWMRAPSISVAEIETRQAAVQHLAGIGSGTTASAYQIVYEELVHSVLPKARPVLRWINQVHTRKASPAQFVRGAERLLDVERLVEELAELCSVAHLDCLRLDGGAAAGKEPRLLHTLVETYPRVRGVLASCLEEIDRDAAIADDLERAVLPRVRLDAAASTRFHVLSDELRALSGEFEAVLERCRAVLGDPSLQFVSLQYGAGKAVHHLVPVARERLHLVPPDWLAVNATKTLVRFHPREIHQLHLRDAFVRQRKRQLVQRAWSAFVAGVDAQAYVMVMDGVEKLAALDALCSLATVARTRPGYSLPAIVPRSSIDEPHVLEIEGGRNAVLDATLCGSASCMGNSVAMRGERAGGAALVLSGPNMGGKSSLLRMCALVVVMAQIGSFVPADRVRLSLFDGVYSRMHRSSSCRQLSGREAVASSDGGASMRSSELEALSAIARRASSSSLVLVDEIGFGMTTEQASAVAFGLVTYLVESVGCHVLFATHMARVADRLRTRLGERRCQTKQFGFSFVGQGGSDNDNGNDNGNDNDKTQQQAVQPQQVVFHYTIKDGVASDSFAMHAARLAGVPEDVQGGVVMIEVMQEAVLQTPSDARASAPPPPANLPVSPPPPASNSRKRASVANRIASSAPVSSSTGPAASPAAPESFTSHSETMAESSECYGSMQQREPLPPPRGASFNRPKSLSADDLEAAKLRSRAQQPRAPRSRWLVLVGAAGLSLVLTTYYFSCNARTPQAPAPLADAPSKLQTLGTVASDTAANRRAALQQLTQQLAALRQPEERVSVNGVLNTTLRVRPAHFTDGPISFWTRSYEGSVPGPTLRVKPGDTLTIELVNELGPNTPGNWAKNTLHSPNTTNLHVHGMHVDPTGVADNVARVVGPGARARTQIHVPRDHPRGLFHYHPHFHGAVFAQMGGGMAGALVVDPDADEAHALPPAYRAMAQQLLVLQEFRFSGGLGSSAVAVAEAARSRLPLRLQYTAKAALDAAVQGLYPGVHQTQPSIAIERDPALDKLFPDGSAGPPITDYFTVNGQYLPKIEVQPRENRLLRLVNAGGVCLLQLSVPGCTLTLTATDGIYLAVPRAVETLMLAAGSRADVVLTCEPNAPAAAAAGGLSEREPLRPLQSVRDTALDGFLGTTSDVFAGVVAFVHVTGEPLQMAPVTQLPTPTPLYDEAASLLTLSGADRAAMAPEPFEFEFTMGGPPVLKDGFSYKNYFVNGKAFDGTSSRDLPLGVVQEWVIVNKRLVGGEVAKANHPFHMHTNAFQVVAMSHGEGAEYRVGDWRDVISVPTPGNVTIRFRPVDFTGVVLAHCHTLGHSDGGMIAAVTIVP
ncbi:hypothetical protein PybrP1_008324 [[Pythium] brassicae (nom. inval.)]|nr:hypothetical protein PybrP1_008324 [[Pythium] brassicae (nom. inval.)]